MSNRMGCAFLACTSECVARFGATSERLLMKKLALIGFVNYSVLFRAASGFWRHSVKQKRKNGLTIMTCSRTFTGSFHFFPLLLHNKLVNVWILFSSTPNVRFFFAKLKTSRPVVCVWALSLLYFKIIFLEGTSYSCSIKACSFSEMTDNIKRQRDEFDQHMKEYKQHYPVSRCLPKWKGGLCATLQS